MTKIENVGSRSDVRKFGLLFGGIGLLAAAYFWYRGNPVWPWLAAAAAIFAVTGLVAVPVLRPVYAGWMKFAHVLAWINTRLLLGIFFYLVMTPVGLVMRLLRRDPLDERPDPAATTYWKKRAAKAFNPADYERLF